ncbi:hypothetical protein WOLCODRAFT_156510 [Wolfiporia cocos MD-104 SS10]|uniref:Uncharacterized protein n=1 Tax=Wolfiporia cocos (strain MD-104) TaxID=742152 RepID=A0A2H3J0W2_WOLCO|nr:hypothetical protein WOLCODRAFT_156510 [Wolfiporia cocos MD-104 SS10]
MGIKVYKEGQVVQWLVQAHKQILRFALLMADEWKVQKLSQLKSYMHICQMCQLVDFTGFYCEPHSVGQEDEVVYISTCTTDKVATYQLHREAFQQHYVMKLYPAKMERLLVEMQLLSEIFKHCQDQPCTAWVEVCVLLKLALCTFTDVPDRFVERSVMSIQPKIWWNFKMMQLVEMHYVLYNIQATPGEQRLWHPSLALKVGTFSGSLELTAKTTCWIYPGVESSNGNGLDDSYVPSEDELYEPCVTGIRQGIYFLGGIIEDYGEARDWQRRGEERRHRTVRSMNDLYKVFGFCYRFGEGLKAHLMRTRRQKNTLWLKHMREEVPVDFEFGLDEENIWMQLVVPPMMWEEDKLEAPDADLEEEEQGGLDHQVTLIWHQMLHDVIALSPNGRSRQSLSYVTLTMVEQDVVGMEVYQMFTLPFRGVVWWVAEKFESDVFDQVFPPRGTQVNLDLKQWLRAMYMQEYQRLMTRT